MGKSNVAMKDGRLTETIRSILGELEPEAAYFFAANGKRTVLLVVDMQDASQIPALAEPWFLALDASIEIIPVMVLEDLEKANPAIQEAVKKYG